MKNRRSIPFSPPDITEVEINNVVEVLKSGWITTGPKTKEFEKKISEYCGTAKTNCLNSCTAAMELTLFLLGIKEGDEIITTAYTYTASASVIDHVGAKIVLVDTEPDSYFPSAEAIGNAINSKTKAIIAVDIAGVMCDYDEIFKVVEAKRDLFTANSKMQELFNRVVVIADAAHSFGATYKGKKSGNVADFTSFSFHAVKNITTAEGGAITWKSLGEEKDLEIYNYINTISLHGQNKDALSKNQIGSWEYDIIYPAFKCNMTDIMAAIGLAQLERYDELVDRRHEMIRRYGEILQSQFDLIQHQDSISKSSGHLMLTRMKSNRYGRNDLIIRLGELGITTNVHYKPLPLLTAYKNLGFDIDDFPNAYNQFKNQITFPLHTLMTDEDLNYINECIEKLF